MRLRLLTSCPNGGFSLLELLVVVAILAACAGTGATLGTASLQAHEARGAAQAWQTAAAWAQVGVLWHGGTSDLVYELGTLTVENDRGLCGGGLDRCLPAVPVDTNLGRWRAGAGARVSFTSLGAPDGGGSVFFQAVGGAFRVIVRPESGLTVRSALQP